jgi:hypothetical protein
MLVASREVLVNVVAPGSMAGLDLHLGGGFLVLASDGLEALDIRGAVDGTAIDYGAVILVIPPEVKAGSETAILPISHVNKGSPVGDGGQVAEVVDVGAQFLGDVPTGQFGTSGGGKFRCGHAATSKRAPTVPMVAADEREPPGLVPVFWVGCHAYR